MNTAKAFQNEPKSTIPAALPDFPPHRVVERKIGKATFIVSSRFSEGREKDIVSTIARLVQHDNKHSERPE